MKTQYTEQLTKEEFLWIRTKVRLDLAELNKNIRYLKDHRKQAKAIEFKKSDQTLITNWYGIEPHNRIDSKARDLGQDARHSHFILGILNGTDPVKIEPNKIKDNKYYRNMYNSENLDKYVLDWVTTYQNDAQRHFKVQQALEVK